MKGKLKLDSDQLKGFFISHGEKVAFGVVIVVVLMMGWKAIQTPMYEREPAHLTQQVNNLRTEIESKVWDRNRPDIPPIPQPPYAVQVKEGMTPVQPLKFAFPQPFNNPIRENKVRRGAPTYYPPVEVMARANRGAVEGTDKAYVGQQWVVITALVPVGEQSAEYQRLFENALHTDPELDTPHYVNFAVQRRMGDAGEWEEVDVTGQLSEALEKFSLGEQVVPSELKETLVCQPSFKLASGSHAGTLAHPPQILEVQPIEPTKEAAPAQAAPAAAAGQANPLARLGQGKPSSAMTPLTSGAVPLAGTATAPTGPPPPYRLMRFFDRSVQSNSEYQYRVLLVLENPNHGVPKRFLQHPDLANDETKRTAWSEPSSPVKIGGDYTLLASEVKAPVGINEAKASIGLVKWDLFQAVEVPIKFDNLMRGSVLSFSGAMASVPVPGKAEVRQTPVDFPANALLVDFTGNESLMPPGGNRPVKSPAEMLFMKPNGELVLGQQMTDSVVLKRQLDKVEQLQAAPAGAEPGGETPAGDLPSIFGLGPAGGK